MLNLHRYFLSIYYKSNWDKQNFDLYNHLLINKNFSGSFIFHQKFFSVQYKTIKAANQKLVRNQFSHYAQSYILLFLQHARNSGKHSDRHYLTCRSFFSKSGGPDWLSTKWAAISVKNVLRCTRVC